MVGKERKEKKNGGSLKGVQFMLDGNLSVGDTLELEYFLYYVGYAMHLLFRAAGLV